MTKDDLIAEAVKALSPVKEILDRDRVGMDSPFKPVIVQCSLEYGRTMALLAIAAGAAGAAVPVELAAELAGPVQSPKPVGQPPAQANDSGLVLPS